MAIAPNSFPLDLNDFDAIGCASDVVVTIRQHAIEHTTNTKARVSAPDEWHEVWVACSPTGNTELQISFVGLTRSRLNNLSKALSERGWQTDEDGEGARLRFRSGSSGTDIGFEILGVLTVAGAPADVRGVVAHDAAGAPISLG